MTATADPSSRFRKAAMAERDRLLRQRGKADAQTSRLRRQLREAEDRLHRLDERIGTLQELAGVQQHGQPVRLVIDQPAEDGRIALQGATIRETAVRTLLESDCAGNPIHYRAWLDLLNRAGYEIAGKRPDAVFLNQIVRSPVVKASTKAGVYELDREAPGRLEKQLARLQLDLHTASAHNALGAEDLERLTLEIRRTQRALREATEALGPPDRIREKAAA